MNHGNIKALHSRYNPLAEAERYVASLTLKESARFLILLEPGLGYMIEPLKKKAPLAKIIALHAADFSGAPPRGNAAPFSEWFPGRGISLRDFLEREIPDTSAEEIEIIEWRPGLGAFGRDYLALAEESAEFIKRADANARTVKTFGRAWFGNFFRNLSLARRFVLPPSLPPSLPAVVTGAGPGLEEAIPAIKSMRDDCFLAAVSSSVIALREKNLAPDMIVATDGGLWARFHLSECFRGNFPRRGALCRLAVYPGASLPSQCAALPLLLLADGSLWQNLLLGKLGIPRLTLPQRGTVSAAALDAAFALGAREIYIAGIDLADRDIVSHARPYSLDRFIEDKEARLNPVYSQTYKRSSALKSGGSYGIYASWFKKQLASYPEPLRTLGGNNPLFSAPLGSGSGAAGAPSRSGENSARNKTPPPFKTIRAPNGLAEKARVLLESFFFDPALPGEFRDALRAELASLLFPEGARPSARELAQTIRALAGGKQRD